LVILSSSAGAIDEAGQPEGGWHTYRSERFGYELSYPPELDMKAWVGGASGDLVDVRSGATVARIELWPSDECPRQPAGVSPRDVGVERVKEVTQADGANSSSSCGDPVTVRESVSPNGVRIFEVHLTCESERSNEDDEGNPVGDPVKTRVGVKGPTFFVDVSPPWKSVVLTVDPEGVDPRMGAPKRKPDVPVVREVLVTVKRLPLEKPNVVCIDELPPQGGVDSHL
jgi:hypothetical protein